MSTWLWTSVDRTEEKNERASGLQLRVDTLVKMITGCCFLDRFFLSH